jgi:hypothetical protein
MDPSNLNFFWIPPFSISPIRVRVRVRSRIGFRLRDRDRDRKRVSLEFLLNATLLNFTLG